MRHAILGVGGVGGLMGAYLAKGGLPVTLVVRQDSVRKYPETLRLDRSLGSFDVAVDRASEVADADVLWVTVKATQLDSALASVRGVDSLRAVVPLLNGIDHLAVLRGKFGDARVVPATIGVEAERIAPGYIVQRSPFVRLNVLSRGREVLEGSLGRLQELGFACQFVDSEPTLMWRKLAFLAPMALTTTAGGKNLGEVLADPVSRQELHDCVREACAVASAEGASIDAEQVTSSFAGFPATMRSSMQKDIAEGRAPELDAISGPILRGAVRHHLEVPTTRALTATVDLKSRQQSKS